MIEFLINNLPAYPREDMDFEYISENNFFSDSEGYTLSVEFPLRGVPENIRVFGHIHREDVAKESVLLDCSIRCGAFFRTGSISVVDVSESSVKAQFIEGIRPEDEELLINKLYVDELDLGSYPVTESKDISPVEARAGTENEVCLPWYNSEADVINNLTEPHIAMRGKESELKWHEDSAFLSWQPYLKVILNRVAAACGYSLDISAIAGSDWEKVIICNSVPGTWHETNYAKALPHWNPSEFFKNVGMVMKGSFSFDHTAKTISFNFYSSLERSTVLLRDVAEEYKASITRDEDDADFLPIMRFKYPDSDAVVWKYLSCPWILDSWRLKKTGIIFDSMEDYEALPSRGRPEIFYVKSFGCWMTSRTAQMYTEVLQPLSDMPFKYILFRTNQALNVFGPPDYDKELKYETLDCSPVPVDYALEGKIMWLNFSGQSSAADNPDDLVGSDNSAGFGVSINGNKYSNALYTGQDRLTHDIVSHKEEDGSACYDSIFLGVMSQSPCVHPFPITDVEYFGPNFVGSTDIFRLERGGVGETAIDPEVKYTFTFVSDSIPDVSSVFVIHGQRYICRKITATFSGNGMSSVLKGEFFRCV